MYFIWNSENTTLVWCLSIIFSYLSGAIPFGFLISKIFFKSDIRKSGSCNIGATNVTRVLGKKVGIIVFILDFLKCAIPLCLISKFIDMNLAKICMHFCVFGHIFPIFLLFKGGKGVTAFLASIAVLYPTIICFVLASWYLIFRLTRYSSLASIISLVFFMCCAFISSSIPDIEKWLSLITVSVILLKHKENIKNLLNMKELSFKK